MWSRNFSSVENYRPALEVQIDYRAAATLPPCAMTSCQSGVRGSAIVAGYALLACTAFGPNYFCRCLTCCRHYSSTQRRGYIDPVTVTPDEASDVVREGERAVLNITNESAKQELEAVRAWQRRLFRIPL
jgi:hypothetical protein